MGGPLINEGPASNNTVFIPNWESLIAIVDPATPPPMIPTV